MRPATRLRGSTPWQPRRDRFDRAQDLGAAAEIVDQFEPAGRRPVSTSARYSAKPRGLRMAEAVDGLVDVAHGVKTVGRAHQPTELRLLAVRVLKLVHQDVVELARASAPALRDAVSSRRTAYSSRSAKSSTPACAFALAINAVEAAQDVDAAARVAARSAP